MKKLLTFILAMVMTISMGITAFAAGETGSITITNATKDQSYSIYMVFDATYTEVGGTKAVAYSIENTSPFFATLFGVDGKTENLYFIYNAETGAVTKRAGVNDTDLVNYLTELVEGATPVATKTTPTDSTNVEFNNLPYGYYVIKSTLGATITINSNTPNVSVIDKNQKPGSLEKKVKSQDDTDYVDKNTANIGDLNNYKITFDATNYDGAHQIKYYQVHDEMGSALLPDINSFCVKVGDVELKKGYLLNLSGDTITIGPKLGEDWGETETRDNAQWYLVYQGNGKFRVTIPWIENHTLFEENGIYRLTFASNAKSIYSSPVTVEVTYNAAIEADATIGSSSNTNLTNKAAAFWICEHETHSTSFDEVLTETFGIGLLKDDATTYANLSGAKFCLYSDANCTKPVYVVPTKIDGVYMIDSYNAACNNVYGIEETSRSIANASGKLTAYLNGAEKENYMVSQVNGKLVVLGLDAGTYYLQEVEAPAGYNSLTSPVEIKAGEGQSEFVIFANDSGAVLDTQTATSEYKEYSYMVANTTVHNSRGLELPATGGEGAVMLISLGSILAIGFAVLLITQKKMSIYRD